MNLILTTLRQLKMSLAVINSGANHYNDLDTGVLMASQGMPAEVYISRSSNRRDMGVMWIMNYADQPVSDSVILLIVVGKC